MRLPQAGHVFPSSAPMMASLICGSTAALLLLSAQHVHGATAWFACAPFAFLHNRRLRLRHAGAAGVTFALTMTMVGEAPWLFETGRGYFGLPTDTASLAAAIVACACGLAYGAALGVGLYGVAALRRRCFALAFAAVWITWEELLVRVVPYYPWAALAPTQVELVAITQVVSLFGQRGLSWAIAFAGVSIGLAARHGGRPRRGHLAAAIVTFLALVGCGYARLQLGQSPPSACSVAAIDAAFGSPDDAGATLERYAALTEEAAAAGASVVVWPESALLTDPTSDLDTRRRLQEIVAASGIPLIAGGRRTVWGAEWKPIVLNSAFLITRADLLAYDKRHLVPFAEYWPSIVVPRPAFVRTEETAAGGEAKVFTIGACQIGILICFEAEQPRLATQLRRAGANALLVLSNDAELPQRAAAREWQQARLRGLETGLAVVRAANHGRSFVADAHGRVIVQKEGGVLYSPLPAPVPAGASSGGPIVTLLGCLIAGLSVVRRTLRR